MDEEKKRHGCLTGCLVTMIVYGSIGLFFGLLIGMTRLLFTDWYRQYLTLVDYMFRFKLLNLLFLFVIFALYILCAIALFRWKKWGFWVFTATALAPSVLYLVTEADVIFALITLLNAVIVVGLLFAALQIGDDDKGWPQLE